MTLPSLSVAEKQNLSLPALVRLIRETQQPDGMIPYWPGHKADPWDHVESAMALTIGGAHRDARRAFEWLQANQLADGSWYAAYVGGHPTDKTRETNHAAYVAVGLHHYFMVTGDIDYIRGMWPVVEAAMDFAIRHQTPSGEIHWAVSPQGQVDRMALVTGCSSIFLSLKCALAMARVLEKARPRWRAALDRLHNCLVHKPHCFNTTKARFSMDWFYPVLCGVLSGQAAQARIESHWKKFVVQNLGVRCVYDRPWVTIAETCELVIALTAMGNRAQASILFRWVCDHTFEDGTFWCGFTFPDLVIWPEEKYTWTNAVVLMAADALFGLTPGHRIFAHDYWQTLDL